MITPEPHAILMELSNSEHDNEKDPRKIIRRKWTASHDSHMLPGQKWVVSTPKGACWWAEDLRRCPVSSKFYVKRTSGVAPSDRGRRERGFRHQISPAFLLSRVVGLIKNPATWRRDNNEICWNVTFHNVDTVSTFTLCAKKGEDAKAFFHGLKETEDEAVDLLNLLTASKFPSSCKRLISWKKS
ncbi:hypothetical protein NUU61_001572 [Penicillium alfredii]|uniref:Uncharacterized protein n=1 Tax=Penicillium alfredii TaxID=1506179 RepID=A0A9W9G3W2_9EURO|nr:uncharacterized protein NUU61_001301 [Penicillium alfredii]XP_056515421.1 uncharacterized protein NUU61_001572 [Penicillium alfredii]KAJ5111671.1 hypothetical protein NUU61_001301 [Penicillium alfredii]KAJ5111942.1 hypothetical protein NUU61_001572 [Penicillium alfredii]